MYGLRQHETTVNVAKEQELPVISWSKKLLQTYFDQKLLGERDTNQLRS